LIIALREVKRNANQRERFWQNYGCLVEKVFCVVVIIAQVLNFSFAFRRASWYH
jgi:hypothetical protein